MSGQRTSVGKLSQLNMEYVTLFMLERKVNKQPIPRGITDDKTIMSKVFISPSTQRGIESLINIKVTSFLLMFIAYIYIADCVRFASVGKKCGNFHLLALNTVGER